MCRVRVVLQKFWGFVYSLQVVDCKMGVDMRRCSFFSAMVLHLLFSATFVNCANLTYWPSDLDALQGILTAWDSTPKKEYNLAGWSTTQQKPCESLSITSVVTAWRGVQCLRTGARSNVPVPVDIIGLSLSNASIVGVLPPAIANLTSLYTLELTGNPNLIGSLPSELDRTWLNVLDLHDNGLSGSIPDYSLFWNLLYLDLSGNRFSGDFNFSQLRAMGYLQTLSIGNNNLTAKLQRNIFQNKTKLQKLDISDNKFMGPLPDLNYTETYLTYLDVSGNEFEGALPDLKNHSALRHVNLSRNKFSGTLLDVLNLIPNTSSEVLNLVDLSYNSITGPLSAWTASNLLQLGSVEELHLDNNSLSGTLDISQMFAQGLLQQKDSGSNSKGTLKVLSLSNNRIHRVKYNSSVIANVTTTFRLDGNPYCTSNYDSKHDGQRCFCKQICFVSPPKSKTVIIAATSSVVGVVLLFLAVLSVMLYKNRRYKQYLLLQFEKKFEEFDVKPTIFTYNELRVATRGFHEDMKLGQGGYGTVYKGVLTNGNVVAVKQLNVQSAQGLDTFLNEVVLITGMKHRNLVNLKGCCLRENQRLLVYEYVDNFDVDQILLGSRRNEVLNWPERLKICLGVARGLLYLHELAHPRVIHRDIKASNILLDKNMEPKIADFGLVLLFPDEKTHIVTVHVAGTKGYLAPEYASLGQVSDKVDVYSFGVLCLEIISGQRNIVETMPLNQIYLSHWAWQLHGEGRSLDLVDPALHLSDDEKRDVQRMINVSLMCIQSSADKRPTMARIVSILQSDMESEVYVLQDAGKGEWMAGSEAEAGHGVTARLVRSMDEGSSSSAYGVKSHPRQSSSVAGVELTKIAAR